MDHSIPEIWSLFLPILREEKMLEYFHNCYCMFLLYPLKWMSFELIFYATKTLINYNAIDFFIPEIFETELEHFQCIV